MEMKKMRSEIKMRRILTLINIIATFKIKMSSHDGE